MADEPVLTTREEIDALERDIERLRVLYQQYFMGATKTEPLTLRKQIYRKILQAKPALITNTGARFKLRNLIQKWNGNLTMWKRIAREMDEGTYRRDLDRARRRTERSGGSDGPESREGAETPDEPAPQPVNVLGDLSQDELERQLQAALTQELTARKAEAPPVEAPAGREDRIARAIMERQARGESLDGLDLDELG